MNNVLDTLKLEYEKLGEETKYALNKWISYLNKDTTYNYNHTSYGLKNYFEKASDMLGKLYCVSNAQFKYAMYINGFEPDEITDDSWCFKISEKQNFNW